ncbi:hypothetical protein KMZ29_20190 [Bradyrhizobium sediminis]|uniref:Uncharacterized protein n=1 Tax=Bradyrhizobium sediminis TaxID=2840469 RepID=A0A975NCI2_9BRAD|nr:hypothetical protein [Bradyrhizobium sediminis]QWG12026.1 hypothetical protein KMZ29_20190 [Bradyrhizobium sediminis]
MVPKNLFRDGLAAMICIMLLAWSGVSVADEYRPDEFLGLDLSRAALSPKRLGPDARFAPVRIEARADRAPSTARAERATPTKARIAHQRAEEPRRAARTKLARRHGNPLDAQASDTRIQAWPCRTGGICNWK